MAEETINVGNSRISVEMEYAKRIEELRIGQKIKVLKKNAYGAGHEVHAGVIVGFEPFPNLPTIVIAYVETGWDKCDVKFLHFNAESKDVQIVAAADPDFEIDRERINVLFEKQIAQKQREIDEIKERQRYFAANFKAYWQPIQKPQDAF